MAVAGVGMAGVGGVGVRVVALCVVCRVVEARVVKAPAHLRKLVHPEVLPKRQGVVPAVVSHHLLAVVGRGEQPMVEGHHREVTHVGELALLLLPLCRVRVCG